MLKWLSSGLVWLLFVSTSWTMTDAADLTSPLELVTSDAAFCLEIPHLEESWTRLESGPMVQRLRRFPPLQRLLESQGFRHWKSVDDHVAGQTGSSLSSQLRAVFAKSLVLAIYVPATGEPRGVLLGESINAESIKTAMATWSKLEPNGVVSNKSHRGQTYFQRKRELNANESQFVAIHGRWFAVSDHESMIQTVIDRFLSLHEESSKAQASANSLAQSNSYAINRSRLKEGAVASVYINARPWDRGLEEGTQGSNDPIPIAEIWKNVTSVSACLLIDQGIVCESVIALDTERTGNKWSQFVSTAASPSTWIPRIPDDALFAVAGRLEIAPAINFLLNQMPDHDRSELAKLQRIVQSLFGGHDVMETVLPELARDFGGFVAPRLNEQTNQVILDGAIGFTSHGPEHATFLANIEHGLDTGLSLLAAYLSVEAPSALTVEREQTEVIRIRSLPGNAFFPIAYGIQGDNLVVAGSRTRLQNALETTASQLQNRRLSNASDRYFQGMNQLIWFDAAQTRILLEKRGPDLARMFSHGSTEEAKHISSRFEQVRPYLELVDSAFISARVESNHIRIVLGGSLDASSSEPPR